MIALATTTAPPAAPAIGQHAAQSPGLGGALLALVAVLLLIVALAWLLKRLPAAGLRSNEQLKVIATLAVGQRERVVVVEVAGEQVMLGITAHTITPLHTLPAPLETAPATQLPPFAQLLARKLRKDSPDATAPH